MSDHKRSIRNRKRKPRRSPVFIIYVLICVCLLLTCVYIINNHSKREIIAKSPDWALQQFLSINQYSRPGIKLEAINGIVVHYVANPNSSASSNRSYFQGLAVTGATHASSHFIIGLEGEVIHCVPLDEQSYASNSRNRDTISIELCHPDESGQLTPATYASLVRLVKWLCVEYRLSYKNVIRHYDVTGKNCPKYFVEHPEAWESFLNQIKRN